MSGEKTSSAGPLLVAASFALIFAFSSVDHAIAPLVSVFADFFGRSQERALWLISSCTLGIVLGIIAGPAFLKSFSARALLNASCAVLAGALALFLISDNFRLSLLLRFVFGLGSGLLSTCMWWLTYEGLDKKYYSAMVTVLMAARPMAVAAGVPLAGLANAAFGWRAAFGLFLALIAAGWAVFALRGPADPAEKKPFKPGGILSEYAHSLEQPHAKLFYGGLLVGKMCYFGMYSFIGIWLERRYALGVGGITSCLL
ncbi:MAG TPA: MFS transporter, partial [Elusimicrobiales bacterium]|nr:MFS transporter [Elusimicrobiales bacterium]